ncbi:phage antirepressor N-terminal domain-containing protein [Pseudomonas sp. RIT-PI-AD]|uniref:phage antirepressor N-terminal domain-containing protein n=1 Tax=Pseudomonas sp. RIT-PI-AD TaxID=3035294 RepID=UPI0021D8685C|nr:phage antirepressor N-terminal domain-containing protein [Pseudomonas sp. RIT-PI-AD]
MNTAPQLFPVPFHGDTVVLVGQDNEPYVAMKPIVSNMGLSWQGQQEKLTERFNSTIREILTVAEDGKQRGMICLPLKKLPAWLYSISPNKVAPELREKIIRYQEECDDALWNYWTQGVAERPGASTAASRIANHRLRLSLAKELYRTRDQELRQLIHQQLADVSNALGLPVPELESIGRAAPKAPDVVEPFWKALAFLDGKGVDYNHALASGLLAVNLPELARLLIEHGQPLRFDSTLRQGLWQSTAPRCLHKNRVIHSRLTDKAIRCWVFVRPLGS